jgi:hypothetical protein
MSDDLDTLQRMLEEATAAGDRPLGELDPQAARLREAWVAFGRLLEADPQAAEEPLRWQSMPPSPRRRPRLAAPLAALAATLLIGLGTVWLLRSRAGREDASSRPGPVVAAVAAGNTVSAGKARAVLPAAAVAEWNDPIDSQLAEVAQDVVGVRESWSAETHFLDLLQYGVRQTSEEVETGSL